MCQNKFGTHDAEMCQTLLGLSQFEVIESSAGRY